MTDETIQALLNQLNTGNGDAQIFIRKLSDSVDIARVFVEIPKPNDRINGSPMKVFSIYFIKANNEKYVGAVIDFNETNLQWYVDPKHRKQGYLTIALKFSILPYILDIREHQNITIENDNMGQSESVAFNVGFKKIENDEHGRAQYQFVPDFYEKLPELNEWNISITENRIRDIKQELHYYARKLAILYNETQMGFGENLHSRGYFLKFKNIIANIEGLGYRMESINRDMSEEKKKQIP